MAAIIGGIEGGSTHTHCVLVNSKDGTIIGTSNGPGTNHHLLGLEQTWTRLTEIVNNAKDSAGISRSEPLLALGLSLSGCEEERSNERLATGLLEHAPNLARHAIAASDVVGSATAAAGLAAAEGKNVGVALIAGTGHNCLRVGPAPGETRQCGGWGFLLGDEGSAYRIAFDAVKICFDELDGFKKSPHNICLVWNLVREHFKIDKQPDILHFFYRDFDKAFVASLCKKLSTLATEENDELSQYLFKRAGEDLARSLCSVLENPSKPTSGAIVLCVGSVWLSWPLLSEGFISQLRIAKAPNLRLVRLEAPPGSGAALLAVERLQLNAPGVARALDAGVKEIYEYDGGVNT